jgi:hypothetical protein
MDITHHVTNPHPWTMLLTNMGFSLMNRYYTRSWGFAQNLRKQDMEFLWLLLMCASLQGHSLDATIVDVFARFTTLQWKLFFILNIFHNATPEWAHVKSYISTHNVYSQSLLLVWSWWRHFANTSFEFQLYPYKTQHIYSFMPPQRGFPSPFPRAPVPFFRHL